MPGWVRLALAGRVRGMAAGAFRRANWGGVSGGAPARAKLAPAPEASASVRLNRLLSDRSSVGGEAAGASAPCDVGVLGERAALERSGERGAWAASSAMPASASSSANARASGQRACCPPRKPTGPQAPGVRPSAGCGAV
mmetsp:Transcript_13783/g.43071  ORF Transcript_13783/g.43071 Transcript_13783/m.43071 type:complete len:140 (-) Transcript_13783:80-499(-)